MLKIKSVIYSILLILSISLSTISGVFASWTTSADSDINIQYTIPGPFTLKAPTTFKTILNTLSGDTAINKIVFDFYTEENMEIIEGATGSVSVETNDTDGIMAYAVPNDTGNTIYILSSAIIVANKSCSGMFKDYTSLKSMEFNNFDTTGVTTLGSMFWGCTKLTKIIGLENWDTSKVTQMNYLFYKCSSLTALKVDEWNVLQVKNFEGMFQMCNRLVDLDLSKWTNSVVTNTYAMFAQCSKLTSINISGFKTSKVYQMSNMFNACTNVTTIYVGSGWTTAAATSSTNMFAYDTKLVGGNGTKFNSSYTDATYARVDTAGAPGYFTLAS